MKVIQANKFYYLKGGAERYMLDVSAWLEAQGHAVVPFAMKHPDNKKTPFSSYFPSFVQTQRVRFGFGGLRTLGRMLYSFEARGKMKRLIKDVHPDICHVHNIYNQLSPSILGVLKARRIPVVMTVHDHHLVSPQYNVWAQGCGDDLRDAGLFKATFSRFHKGSLAASFAQTFVSMFHRSFGLYRKNVDLFITPSIYLKRQMVRGGIPAEQIRVSAYGIDASQVKPSYTDKKYFLFVGRLSEEKGVETLLHVARVIPDITFKIVGRGPEMDYLHKLGHDLPNVEFLGFRMGDELKELYRGATAVLLPSRVHENFPLISLEAMAAGKPLIASDVGGVPEVVEDRVTGLLVAPTDVAGWTEAIMRLAYDDAFREQLSRAARAAVEQKYTLESHFKRLMDIYEEVTGIHT